MSRHASTQEKGGIGGFVEAARKVFAFSGSPRKRDELAASRQAGAILESPSAPNPSDSSAARTDTATSSFVSRLLGRRPATPARSGKRRVVRGKQNHATTVRKLAAAGLDYTEISRRTSLSQDLVVLLLNLGTTPAAGQSARQ